MLSLLACRLFFSEQQEVMDGVLSVLLSHEDVLVLLVDLHRVCIVESVVLLPITSLVKEPPFNVTQLTYAAL